MSYVKPEARRPDGRRDDRAFGQYVREERRRQPGCPPLNHVTHHAPGVSIDQEASGRSGAINDSRSRVARFIFANSLLLLAGTVAAVRILRLRSHLMRPCAR
jgi:hypothetical protein